MITISENNKFTKFWLFDIYLEKLFLNNSVFLFSRRAENILNHFTLYFIRNDNHIILIVSRLWGFDIFWSFLKLLLHHCFLIRSQVWSRSFEVLFWSWSKRKLINEREAIKSNEKFKYLIFNRSQINRIIYI